MWFYWGGRALFHSIYLSDFQLSQAASDLKESKESDITLK